MSQLTTWAAKWGIPWEAVDDLKRQIGVAYQAASSDPDVQRASEKRVQSEVLLESARKNWHLWRNNVGMLMDERAIPVRFGLCNDSKQINAEYKSADLIGIRPVVITPELIGHTIGQFASIEVKREGWQYTGNDHERAQLQWAQLVISAGGYAAFVNQKGLLP